MRLSPSRAALGGAILLGAFVIGSTIAPLGVFSATLADTKVQVSNSISALIESYEARIKELETENATLRTRLQAAGIALGVATGSVSTGTTTSLPAITISATSGSTATISTGSGISARFNAVITLVNSQSGKILEENGLKSSTGAAIAQFEFVNNDAVFVDLDDGKTASGAISTFKRKILYAYTLSGSVATLTRQVGIFEFQETSGKYLTLSGNNPYAGVERVKIKNPEYKGKIIDASAIGSVTSNTTTTTTASGTTATNASVDAIKTAYNKNKYSDAITLSDAYLLTDANNLDVRRIRYRSLYVLKRYDEALKEIAAIEAFQGTSFLKSVACEGSLIAKQAKNDTAFTKYDAICKAK